jgi:hypothetical protein
MATAKQIRANRINARKSTGPKTPETRAKTSLNAKRDGFTGQVTSLSEEDRPIFEKFKRDLVTDLAPKTVMELSLANSIAWDTWRLNHLRAVEMNLYALGTADPDSNLTIDCENPQLHTAMANALTFGKESPRLALMSIYEQRMNRSLHKNLETLRKLQAERKTNYERDRAEEVVLARYSDIKGLTYQSPAVPNQNGSVFSNSEIFTAANRLTTLMIAKGVVCHAPLKVQFAGASSSAPSNVIDWPKEPDAA